MVLSRDPGVLALDRENYRRTLHTDGYARGHRTMLYRVYEFHGMTEAVIIHQDTGARRPWPVGLAGTCLRIGDVFG